MNKFHYLRILLITTELKDRLKKIRKDLEIGTQGDLKELLAVNLDRIKSLETGKAKELTAREANVLVKKFHLDINWILTGEGEMFDLQEVLPSVDGSYLSKKDEKTITLNYYEDIHAAAGYGATNGDVTVPPQPINMGVNFLRTFFNVQSVQDLDIINVVGDSMEPFIKNGEKVIVERTHEASNNNIVIALVGTELYVKRLIKDPFGEWIKLTSENQYYEDIMITQDKMHKLKIIGIVRGRVRPF